MDEMDDISFISNSENNSLNFKKDQYQDIIPFSNNFFFS